MWQRIADSRLEPNIAHRLFAFIVPCLFLMWFKEKEHKYHIFALLETGVVNHVQTCGKSVSLLNAELRRIAQGVQNWLILPIVLIFVPTTAEMRRAAGGVTYFSIFQPQPVVARTVS